MMLVSFRIAPVLSVVFLSTIFFSGARLSLADDGPAVETGQDEPTTKIKCRITDSDGKAIAGARIEVLKWTGKYERINAVGTTDQRGMLELEFPHSDDYFYVLFSADGFASSMRDLQANSGETQEIEFRLSRPVSPWLIVTADDKPLSGAEVSSISFLDANDSQVYLSKGKVEKLGFKLSTSDSSGRLDLPVLPAGSKVDVTVVHPERRTVKRTELIAAEKQLATIDMKNGVPVTLHFSSHSASKQQLEGKKVSVSLSASTGSSMKPSSMRHDFTIRDGRIRFTAFPVEFSSLRLSMDEYIATPNLMNLSEIPTPELDLSDAQPASFDIRLRSKVKAYGRVVDANGDGVANAWVTSEIANEPGDKAGEAGESDESIEEYLRNWSSAGNAETDRDGNYQIDVAQGSVRLEVIREGYFSSPAETETIIAKPHDNHLPDLSVFEVPVLRGTVVDSAGQPVGGAIVRMRHTGRGDANPLCESAADGTFEFKMSRIPYKYNDRGLETDVSVVAIDPKSNRGGIANVNVLDESSTFQISIELAEKSPEWALNVIRPDRRNTGNADQKTAASLAAQFPKGVAGNQTPDLSEGTWLNTDASSLKDFRGQFVLLDFLVHRLRAVQARRAHNQVVAREVFRPRFLGRQRSSCRPIGGGGAEVRERKWHGLSDRGRYTGRRHHQAIQASWHLFLPGVFIAGPGWEDCLQ